jgi:hypothetical protein
VSKNEIAKAAVKILTVLEEFSDSERLFILDFIRGVEEDSQRQGDVGDEV